MEANKSAAKDLRAMLKSGQQPQPGSKRPAPKDSDSEEETPDEVRLYEDGFKNRYYESKFGVLPEDLEFRHVAHVLLHSVNKQLSFFQNVNKQLAVLKMSTISCHFS